MISEGMIAVVQDPTEAFVAPKPKAEVPFLNFAPLQNALAKLQESAKNYQTASKNKQLSPAAQKSLGEILYRTERALTRSEGLPRRAWFKHQIYAPGFYTGYGVKTLPAVREAIEQRDWKEASEQIEIVARTIENFTAEIDKATNLIR
jgi:N-acetylated-alpha-linked acidic dipeptidase